MSLIDQLKAEENKKNKLFHEIIMAAATAKHNIEKSKTAKRKEYQEKHLENALADLYFIQELALSANNGTYEKEENKQ